MFHALRAIVTKEVIDGLRDKRSLLSALLFPFLGPVLIAVMLTTIVNDEDDTEPLVLPMVGAEYAPSLVTFLESQGVQIEDAPEEPEIAIRDGDLDVVLVISEDYGERFEEGFPASVQLIMDKSRTSARTNIERAKQLVAGYSGQIGTLRLLARGISPGLVNPLAIDEVDLSTPQKRAASLLDMITMFVVLSAFFCNMYIAIDTSAGERERRSLEPLLINPVPRPVMVLGKWIATVVFGTLGMLLTLIFMGTVMSRVPVEEIGLRIALGPDLLFETLIIVLPLALLAGALQLLVSSFARSFKEAQTYLSFTLFLPMLPGIILSFNPVKSETWMMLVPMLGQQLLVSDRLRGDPLELLRFGLATSSTLVVTAVLLAATVALFERESIVFGK